MIEELILSCLPLDINALTKNNWTPLMMAADRGYLRVVELLIKYRADIHVTSTDGKTAIFLARESKHTEISQRLHRTPGSTKDYLSWLEDVDLVTSRQKRYSFTDPLLRLWVRLHCRPVTPSADEIAREVQRYAVARLPQVEPVPALAYAGVDASLDERKSWGIIEID